MRNFHGIFETRKQSFISTFSICMTVPLSSFFTGKFSYIFPLGRYLGYELILSVLTVKIKNVSPLKIHIIINKIG